MKILSKIKKALGIFAHYYVNTGIEKLGKMGDGSRILIPADLKNPQNIFLDENVLIGRRSTIMTTGNGILKMGRNSGTAEGLTVICSTHDQAIGGPISTNDNNIYYTIEVEEDVWIGTNVTLLPGSHIGRGAILGADSTVRTKIPPYAMVVGNPAKVVGFKFTPEEIIEHEKALYPEEERLPLELLEKNYKKYFLDHIKEIKAYTGLICK